MDIAYWYTGSSKNWIRLTDANPALDPKQIQIGDTIRIPESILTRRKQMPKPARPASAAKKKAQPSETANPPAPALEKELFGPIEESWSPNVLEDPELPRPLQTLD